MYLMGSDVCQDGTEFEGLKYDNMPRYLKKFQGVNYINMISCLDRLSCLSFQGIELAYVGFSFI